MGNIKFEGNKTRIFISNGDFTISQNIYKELWKCTDIPKKPHCYLCEEGIPKKRV